MYNNVPDEVKVQIADLVLEIYRSQSHCSQPTANVEHDDGEQETSMQLGWNNRGTLSVLGETAHLDHIFRSKVVELILEGCEPILLVEDPDLGFGPVFVLQPTLSAFWTTPEKELVISPQAVAGAEISAGISGLIDAIVVVLGMVVEVYELPEQICGANGSFNSDMLDFVTYHSGMAFAIRDHSYISALMRGNIAIKGRMVIRYRYKSVEQKVLVDISLATMNLLKADKI